MPDYDDENFREILGSPAMCKGEAEVGSPTLRKTAHILDSLRSRLELAFEFRHAGVR